jgi:hypothetical protein
MPKSEEMTYVYKKTQNYEDLKDEYSKSIQNDPSNIDLKKEYMKTLDVLDDESKIVYAENYYHETKDKKTARKIIEHYKAKNDYPKAIYWLDILYNDYNEAVILDELIDYTSYAKKIELEIEYLKEKYNKTNDNNILFDMYSLGEKEISLDMLFDLSKNGKLKKDEILDVLINLIHAKKFKKASILYEKFTYDELNVLKYKEEYLFLYDVLSEDNKILSINKYLYKNTNKKEYFDEITSYYINEGEIDKLINEHKKRYKNFNSKDSLEAIVEYLLLDERLLEGLSYLENISINNNNTHEIKYIISEYINMDEIFLLNNFLDKLTINLLSEKYNELSTLILNSHLYLKNYSSAKKILLKYKPKEVNSDLIVRILENKINEETLPYFMRALKKSNDESLLAKLFKYRYKTMRLFEESTYKVFGKPEDIVTLNLYVDSFDIPTQKKIYKTFYKKSNNPTFILKISENLINYDNYEDSKDALLKVLTIDKDNKEALNKLNQIFNYENDIESSERTLKTLIKIDNNDINALFELANIYHSKKEYSTSFEYYETIKEINKQETLNEKRIYLISKARLTNPFDVEENFMELIEISSNKSLLIKDLLLVFIETKNYEKVLELLDFFSSELPNNNVSFDKINIEALLNTNKLDEAAISIEELSLNDITQTESLNYYKDLGYLYNDKKDKVNALKFFKKSIGNTKNKEIMNTIKDLQKDLSSNIGFKVGVSSKLKELSVEATYVKDDYKVTVRNDTYEDYNSSKLILSDKNDKYSFGAGQDYLSLKLNHINNSNLSINAEHNMDTNSVSTVKDELTFNKLNLSYYNLLIDNLSFSSIFSYYKYDKFNRLVFENGIHYNIIKNYYVNTAYKYEKVNKRNIYGYDDLSVIYLSLSNDDNLNNNIFYNYNIGLEIVDSNVNPYVDFNLIYKNRYVTTSLESNISNDTLIDEYNYSSILNFKYYFINQGNK